MNTTRQYGALLDYIQMSSGLHPEVICRLHLAFIWATSGLIWTSSGSHLDYIWRSFETIGLC